ncbi:hypothetical protein [Nocardioides marmoraquaticus]
MSAPVVPPRRDPAAGARLLLPGLLGVPVLTLVLFVFFGWWVGDAEARGVDTSAHGFAFLLVFPLGALFVLDVVLYVALLRRPEGGRVALAVVNGSVAGLILLLLLVNAASIGRGSVIAAAGAAVGALVMVASAALMWRGPFVASARPTRRA